MKPEPTPHEVTVWYDGDCPLCRREIAWLRRLDRRVDIHLLHGAAGASCPVDRATLLERFHAREADGPLVSGAGAFAAMWRAIPVLRPFGRLARIPAVLWMLEHAYRAFLIVRPALQAIVRRLGGAARETP